jgi:hypothetical protein
VRFFADGMEQVRCGFETRVNLYRILQEALNNARKHAAPGGWSCAWWPPHPHVILRVEDDGVGFELESRLVEALAEKRLGLWSMRERARLLGGSLIIRSRAGQGTRITVEIPCPEERMSARARVLVVDDHPLFREGLKAILDRDGRFAPAGEAAPLPRPCAWPRSLRRTSCFSTSRCPTRAASRSSASWPRGCRRCASSWSACMRASI